MAPSFSAWPHSRSLLFLRVFFDSCDGFFTNYNWREEHLERMLGQAGERRADVYVGVDVFARGNVVGGRFDTDKVGGGFRPRASGPVPPLGPCFLMDLPFPSAPQRNESSCSSQSGYPVALRNRVSCPGQAVSPLKPLSWLFLQSDNVFLCGCYQTEVRCSPAVWSSAGLGLLSQLCSLTFPPREACADAEGPAVPLTAAWG